MAPPEDLVESSQSEHKCTCTCKPQPRNLVVSIDGTSNQFGLHNTNVVELHSRILKDESADQLTYYNSGIGTYAPPSISSFAYWKQYVSNAIDLAIAWNFVQIVQGAYRWLADHYRPGDRIFLFGFSRGAYQVRALAGMIHKVGLVFPGNQEQIPFAYELYVNKLKGRETDQAKKLAEHFKLTFSRSVGVHFLGLWDTVSSVGISRDNPLPLTDSCDHICFFRHALALDECRVKFLPEYLYGKQSGETSYRPDKERSSAEMEIEYGQIERSQSMASSYMGERDVVMSKSETKHGQHDLVNSPRNMTFPLTEEDLVATSKINGPSNHAGRSESGMSQPENTGDQIASSTEDKHLFGGVERIKEVWFAGSHSDIGGGNKENVTLDLADVPLLWMETEAKAVGLKVQPRTSGGEWNWDVLKKDRPRESLTGSWWILEVLPFKRSTYTNQKELLGFMNLPLMMWVSDSLFVERMMRWDMVVVIKSLLKPFIIRSLVIVQGLWVSVYNNNEEPPGLVDVSFIIRQLPDALPLKFLMWWDVVVFIMGFLNLSLIGSLWTLLIIRFLWWVVGWLLGSNDENTTRYPHFGNGRTIVDGQKIHASVAFKDSGYKPKAVFTKYGMEWDSLVGTGSIEDTSWSQKWETHLEMDLFDMSFVDHAIQELHNPKMVNKDATDLIRRMAFMALSSQGAEQIGKLTTIEDLVTILSKNADLRSRAASADCLSRLAKHENPRSLILKKAPVIIFHLTEMLQNKENDINVQVSSADLLTHLAFGDRSSPDAWKGILNTGTITLLVRLLKSSDHKIQCRVATCLSRLGYHAELRTEFLKADAVKELANMLKTGVAEVRGSSVTCLSTVAACCVQDEMWHKILDTDIIESLAELLDNNDKKIQELGINFFSSLVRDGMSHEAQAAICQAGVVSKLAKLLQSAESAVRVWCISQLRIFLKHDDLRSAMLTENVIHLLVTMVERDSLESVCSCLRYFTTYEDSRAKMVEIASVFVDMLRCTGCSDSFTNNEVLPHVGGERPEITSSGKTKNPDSAMKVILGKEIAANSHIFWSEGASVRKADVREIGLNCLSTLVEFEDARAAFLKANILSMLAKLLHSSEPPVRFWGAISLRKIFRHDDLRAAILAENVIRLLLTLMQSNSPGVQLVCSFRLRDLAKYDDSRAKLLEFVPVLVDMLRSSDPFIPIGEALAFVGAKNYTFTTSSGKTNKPDSAMRVLIELGKHSDALAVILQTGAIAATTTMIQSGDSPLRNPASNLLKVVSKHNVDLSKDVRSEIARLLVSILNDVNTPPVAEDHLAELCTLVVSSLTEPLNHPEHITRDIGVDCLSELMKHEVARVAILENNTIPKLATLIRSSSSSPRFWGIISLHKLSSDADFRAVIMEENVIPSLIRLMQSYTPCVRTASSMLLTSLAVHDDFRKVIMKWDGVSVFASMLKNREPPVLLKKSLTHIGAPEGINFQGIDFQTSSCIASDGGKVLVELGKYDDAIPPMVAAAIPRLLLSDNAELQELGIKLLRELSQHVAGRAAILGTNSIQFLDALKNEAEDLQVRSAAADAHSELAKYGITHQASGGLSNQV